MQFLLNSSWPLIKPILFQMDPEDAHHFTLNILKRMPIWPKRACSKSAFSCHGLNFRNRIGLAAGMDKNAECLHAWQYLGFGFIEIGTVTSLPQPGNPKPRLFRLKEHKALYNRMGFNNDGALVISQRIKKQLKKQTLAIPLGINIGKSAITPLEDAPKDYLKSFELLADCADYITINVSSPNTKDLRKLQKLEGLLRILDPIFERNASRQKSIPILVKLAPDLEIAEAIDIAKGALSAGAIGLIISNTTVKNFGIEIPTGGGGLSGTPLFQSSTTLLNLIRQAVGQKPLLIGSGGVTSASQAAEKVNKGADLVQIYSGLVYNGPGFPNDCVKNLSIT